MMTGKAFLKQIRDINITIKGLQMDLSDIDTKLTRTTTRPKTVNVQTSLPADPMADLVIKRVELEKKIINQINLQWDIKIKAIELIGSMDSQDKSVLTLRYINCMTYKEMMDQMDASRATVANRLREAEKHFDVLYTHNYT